jgi:hypothetical protein
LGIGQARLGACVFDNFPIPYKNKMSDVRNSSNSATIRRVNRADAYLETLVDRKVLSQEGKDWLRLFLDPFHDTSIDPQPYVDGQNTVSVSEIINLDFPVRKPTALAAGNWTCHIFTLPVMGGCFMSTSGIATIPPGQNIPGWLPVSTNDATSYGVNMVNIHAALDGTNLGPFSLSPATFVGSLGVPLSFKTGVRVDAFGYEVHNTTSRLNVQGMSTHYRIPMYEEAETVNLASIAGVSLGCSARVYEFPSPPGNTANALQILGTTQWEARLGNYTVVPMNGIINPPVAPANTGFYFFDPTNNRYIAENVVSTLPFITLATGVGFPDNCFAPTAIAGSFYSGLSDATTLTVKVKICIERFPSIQVPLEAELVRLCRSTPPRDSLALEIASQCIRSLPVSVVVSENSFGEWFIDVADKVINSVTPILKMIPNPIAQALGAAGSILGPAAAKINMENRVANLNKNNNSTPSALKNKRKAPRMPALPPTPSTPPKRSPIKAKYSANR